MRYFVIGGITDTDHPELEKEMARLKDTCNCIGHALCKLGHSLIICSPFKDTADYWAFNGFIQYDQESNNIIEFHFVDTETVRAEIVNLELTLKTHSIVKIPHPAPINENQESLKYAWLLCQLQALESCHMVIAIGGKIDGSSNMLLLLAEAKRKPILPLSFLGGAAGQAFHRRRYELEDRLGNNYILLQDEKKINEILENSEKMFELQANSILLKNHPKFFISYPRARPYDADYIETLLRRRNMQVFRDESDFGAGHAIPTEITEAIYESNIFIAVWCAEYACSPWCFDELELALDRYDSGKIKLWIFCTDNTRIVPSRARILLNYSVKTREDIEGHILTLLEREIGK